MGRRLLLGIVTIAVLAVGLRAWVTVTWPDERCLRDECMYQLTARRMADGDGMTASNGWLWAPGYVAVLAAHRQLDDHTDALGRVESIGLTQSALGGVSVLLLVALGHLTLGTRAGLAAGTLYALNPTLIFYASRGWSETFYSTLLLAAVLTLLLARDRHPTWAAAPGVLLGSCVLFRGIATYMLPVFVLGVLWQRWRQRRAWATAAVLVVCTVLTVLPYSVYATRTFGGTVISDRTLGQMMFLGNNDFEPVTFDYGAPTMNREARREHQSDGREHCAPRDEPLQRDACELASGLAWIRAHPAAFVQRIPIRLAQLANPNSFLTRHLRHHKFVGLTDAQREVLCIAVVGFTLLGTWAAAAGAWAFGRRGSSLLVVVGTITAYHVAAVALTAGLTRYRLPLEVLWLVFAGAWLVAPREGLQALRAQPWRATGLAATLLLLVPLQLWLLPWGFPQWSW